MRGFPTLLLIPCLAFAEGAYLGDLTWPEAADRLDATPVVIVPFGAGAKEHGRHLPMNADRVFMEHLVEVAVTRTQSLAAPPILYGWFPAFRDFPGTEIEDATVFQDYVYLAAKSLVRSGARRIVFLNTGISHATGLPIAIAAREIRQRCRVPTLVVSWDDLETDEVAEFTEQRWGGHADEIETSINLALQPDRVRMDQAVKAMGRPPKDYPGYRPGVLSRDRNDPGHAEDGIRGDPETANEEKGRKALAVIERNWLAALHGFAAEPLPSADRTCSF